MRNSFLLLLIFPLLFSCNKKKLKETEKETYKVEQAYTLSNISYGANAAQVMDIYLPANRTENTKVFVMIHGGGWNAGDKSDFKTSSAWLKVTFPNHAIININYRLATLTQPGYNMQIEDIQSAIAEIRKPIYGVGEDIFVIGGSAGAQLAMMYAYDIDKGLKVKGVCNIVGPADFSDPNYSQNTDLEYALYYLIGPYTYAQHPEKWHDVSPVFKVTSTAPPTISFYGGQDHLIPNTQMGLLQNALENAGVTHQETMYPNEGHVGWSTQTNEDFVGKVYQFVRTHFDY